MINILKNFFKTNKEKDDFLATYMEQKKEEIKVLKSRIETLDEVLFYLSDIIQLENLENKIDKKTLQELGIQARMFTRYAKSDIYESFLNKKEKERLEYLKTMYEKIYKGLKNA